MDARALYVELLERRAELLNLLALELRSGRPSMITIDVAEIDRQSMRQASLCEEVRFISEELASLYRSEFETGSGDHNERLHAALAITAKAIADVTRAERVQAAFLRRSRRSINVMMNVLSSGSGAYLPSWTSLPVHSLAVGA